MDETVAGLLSLKQREGLLMKRRHFLRLGGLSLGAVPLLGPHALAGQRAVDPPRVRLRQLGIVIGSLEPGPYNAITDVGDVAVGHTTLIRGEGPLVVGQGPVRTGVTAVVPHGGDYTRQQLFAADFTLNGNGEMTGLGPLRRTGRLGAPILLTNTSSVGTVYDGAMGHMLAMNPDLFAQQPYPEPLVGRNLGRLPQRYCRPPRPPRTRRPGPGGSPFGARGRRLCRRRDRDAGL